MASGSWGEYFGTRRWRVAAEVSGLDKPARGTVVTFTKGRFTIEGGVFHSPLSSARGRTGVLLQETDPGTGADIPGSRAAVGVVVYRRARREGAVR